MTTEVLGKLSFLETPDVNGLNVLIDGGGVPNISSGITSSRPAAGTGAIGRLFLDTTTNKFYRDDGSSWIDLTAVPSINGTTDEIDVTAGTNVTPAVVGLASNPIIPGTASMTLPKGTTANRPTGVSGMQRFNTTINEMEMFNGTSWVPMGRVLQLVSGTIPASSGTTTIPLDATAPLSTEGSQILSQVFTPISATSKIVISFNATSSHSTAARSNIFAMFAGTTNIGSAITTCAVASAGYPISMHVVHQSVSTAAITFSLRTGSNSTGTWYINQSGATNTLGGTLVSEFTIMEIQ